jgi:hypothetical protein
MQNPFFLPARPSTLSRSNSSSRFHPLQSQPPSKCAIADPVIEPRPDDLHLLHPSVQLVLLSNDASFCSLTRSFLRHAGFAIFTCTTSDRAESLFLNRSNLQLWIIDVQALGIEAVYFATLIREHHPGMPILLILGEYPEYRTLGQFLFHGWNLLTKPVDFAKMLTTINDVLTKSSRGSARKHFKPERTDAPSDPFEADWLNDLHWTHLSRMRN